MVDGGGGGMFSPRVRFQVSVLLLIACSSIAAGSSYDKDIDSLSGRIAETITASGKKRVAVVDFTDLQGNVTELGRFLAEELSIPLSGAAKDFRVIDRTHLKTILQEHKLSSTGIIDPRTARRLGEIAGVDALVTGTITPLGETVRLSVKVLDVSTAELIGASSLDIPRTKAIEELLAGVLTAEARPQGTPSGSKPRTQSASAVTVEDNDFVIEINRCVRSGQTIECLGSVTNRATKVRNFTFLRSTYMVDNLGNAYSPERSSSGGTAELHPELPRKFEFLFRGVSVGATSANLAVEYQVPRSGGIAAALGGGPTFKVLLRDIQLQSK